MLRKFCLLCEILGYSSSQVLTTIILHSMMEVLLQNFALIFWINLGVRVHGGKGIKALIYCCAPRCSGKVSFKNSIISCSSLLWDTTAPSSPHYLGESLWKVWIPIPTSQPVLSIPGQNEIGLSPEDVTSLQLGSLVLLFLHQT